MIGEKILTSKVVAQVNPPTGSNSLIKIEEIEIFGNTVFSVSELQAILAELLGKEISENVLKQAQRRIDNYYISRGYVSTGSFVLLQHLSRGKVQIQIIEGILADIQLQGLSTLNEKYIKSRLPEQGKPLNANDLIESLERLKKDPLIKEISGQLNQSSIGKNVLLIELEENSPVIARLNLTNAYSPSIGRNGGNASITHRNLLGFGDHLNVNSSQTQGLTRFGGSYSFPINNLDGRIIFKYNVGNAELTEEEIEQLGIEADFESFELSFSQPVISNRSESLIFGLGLEYIDTETFVLDDFSFSFTDGLPDGTTQLTVLRLFQDYSNSGDRSLFTVNSQFNVGLDLFDATVTKVGIDGIFWSWQSDIQYLFAFNKEKDLVLGTRLNLQLTPDKLLANKQFLLGGLSQVRGYRPNLGVADNGIIGTIELQVPLLRGGRLGEIAIIPFFDVGTIWNNGRGTTGTNTFASSGLALRYRYNNIVEFRLDYGIPLINLEGFGATDTEDNLTLFISVDPLNLF